MSNKKSYILAGGIFFLLITTFILISIFTAERISDDVTSRFQTRLSSDANEINSKTEQFLDSYSSVLFSARGLIDASDFVRRDEWKSFVETLQVSTRYPALKAVEFAPRVNESDKIRFTDSVVEDTSIVAEGYPDFSISPPGDRQEYYVVDYIEPIDGNNTAFGFDLFSNESRREAIELARDTNTIIITEPITLVQETGSQKAFLMILPVYSSSNPLTLLERRRDIVGVILGVVRAGDFFSQIARSTELQEVVLFDVGDIATQDYLSLVSGVTYTGSMRGSEDLHTNPEYSRVSRINVGKRLWEMHFRTVGPGEEEGVVALTPMLIVITGLIISLLVGMVVINAQRLRSRAEQMAQELTLNLTKANKLFAIATKAGNIGVWRFDLKTKKVEWSTELYQMHNLSSSTKLDIEKTFSYIKDEDRDRVRMKIYDTLATTRGLRANASLPGMDYAVNIGEGDEKFLYSVGYIIVDDKGIPEQVIGITQDISERKKIDKTKTEFVSIASHQLRTPLSAVNWYTEVLLTGEKGKLTSGQKDYLLQVAKSNKRMIDLVDSLLKVSRLELGTFMVDPVKIHIKKIIDPVVAEIKTILKEKKKNINISVHYGKNIPEMDLDPKLMRVIVENLLSNAVKYTPEKGSVAIEVSVVRKSGLGAKKKISMGGLHIKVKDTGYGIPTKQHKDIFTKLFRADNIRDKETDGTGLGLYVVKQIIDYCRGSVWFTSAEDKGSTFHIVLPSSGMKRREGTEATK